MQHRRLLQPGIAIAAVVAVAGGSLALLQPGLAGGQLAPSARAVLAATATALLDGALPASASDRQTALAGLLQRVQKVTTAHVMGGCGFAGDQRLGVVRSDGVHWQPQNLSVHDGSIFPTSLDANPQLSIYGIANRLAQGLARRLGAADVTLAA